MTALHLEVATCDHQLQGHHGNLARKDPPVMKKESIVTKKKKCFFLLFSALAAGYWTPEDK